MIRSFVTATILSAASLAFAGAVHAQVVVPKNQEFAATPIQKGAPTDLPGERLIPGASQIATGIDVILAPTVIAPIQQVGGGVGGSIGTIVAGLPVIGGEPAAAPAAAAAPAKKRMMRHHMSKKHMMKKHMMKKHMMKKKM